MPASEEQKEVSESFLPVAKERRLLAFDRAILKRGSGRK